MKTIGVSLDSWDGKHTRTLKRRRIRLLGWIWTAFTVVAPRRPTGQTPPPPPPPEDPTDH